MGDERWTLGDGTAVYAQREDGPVYLFRLPTRELADMVLRDHARATSPAPEGGDLDTALWALDDAPRIGAWVAIKRARDEIVAHRCKPAPSVATPPHFGPADGVSGPCAPGDSSDDVADRAAGYDPTAPAAPPAGGEATDKLAHVKVGDEDPTPLDGDCPARSRLWACTRPAGHPGQHIAGDGSMGVRHVWDGEPCSACGETS